MTKPGPRLECEFFVRAVGALCAASSADVGILVGAERGLDHLSQAARLAPVPEGGVGSRGASCRRPARCASLLLLSEGSIGPSGLKAQPQGLSVTASSPRAP